MSWQIEGHHRVCFICQILHGALVKYLNLYEVESEKYLLIKFQIKIKISTTNWLLSMKTNNHEIDNVDSLTSNNHFHVSS